MKIHMLKSCVDAMIGRGEYRGVGGVHIDVMPMGGFRLSFTHSVDVHNRDSIAFELDGFDPTLGEIQEAFEKANAWAEKMSKEAREGAPR